MNRYINILLLIVLSFLALYFNLWYLILFAGVIYGLFSPDKTLLTGGIAFFVILLLWAALLFVKDKGFAVAPSVLLSKALGGIPNIVILFIGGLVGGLVAFLGAIGGRLFKS